MLFAKETRQFGSAECRRLVMPETEIAASVSLQSL
jgi:hypothetical protein